MRWTIAFYNHRIESDIHDLSAGLVARFIRCAERMEIYGPDLGMPHTRAMGGGLFELRIKSLEGIARVFYCTIVDRHIVFLHQFVKKSERTPLNELRVAQRRMSEVRK